MSDALRRLPSFGGCPFPGPVDFGCPCLVLFGSVWLGVPVWTDPVWTLPVWTFLHRAHATVLHFVGFDHKRLTYRNSGRDSRLTDVHDRVVDAIIQA